MPRPDEEVPRALLEKYAERLFHTTGKRYPKLYKLIVESKMDHETLHEFERFLRDIDDEKAIERRKGNREAQMGRLR